MKENKYNDPVFFEKYNQMPRSRQGLSAAGEWRTLEPLLPDFAGKEVLDLGCGYGWHCVYAAEHGARQVTGIDLSDKMLAVARQKTSAPNVEYRCCAIEDADFADGSFDIVLSSLALHYVEDYVGVVQNVHRMLRPGGVFLFSCEHPVFTAGVNEDWIYDKDGNPEYWPVDDYYYPGERSTLFLGKRVRKYHHTLTQILMGMLNAGFALEAVEEAVPDESMLDIPGMKDEMRRPMMLLVRARK